MNTTQTVRYIKFGVGVLAASSLTIGASSAQAASFNFTPTTVDAIVNGGGPSFTITDNFTAAGATISFEVDGIVNLDTSGALYNSNAAGIVTTPTSTVGPAGSFLAFGPNNVSYGSLLLGNNTLGFQQVFPSTPANGAGSSTPPSSLSFTGVSLATLFSGGLASGDILEFRVADDNYSDNSGSFTVSGLIQEGALSPATDVPEPFTIVGTLIGGTAAIRMRKKLKANV